MHPSPPVFGPVRSPRGRVLVTVTPLEVCLRPHDSWTDWFDSDLVLAGSGLAAIALAVTGLVVGGVGGTALLVVAAALGIGVVGFVLATYVLMAYVVLRGAVLLLSRRGRDRLKRGAVEAINELGTGRREWRIERSDLTAVLPIDRTLRPRLRLVTTQGEIALRTRLGKRERLEGVAWQLGAR